MKRVICISALTGMILLTGCNSGMDPNSPRELIYIAGLSNGGRHSLPNFREQILTETAMTVGAQAGLQWRAEQIDCTLREQEERLEQVYNFRNLLLRDHVLPPVLSEGRQTLNLSSAETIRTADTVYRIIKPPRFVTAAPNWREYLWLSYEKPEEPNATLLPKNPQEAALWNCIVKRGWDKGIDQANEIFIASLERLNRDYLGIILYHRLYAQNMVSAPFVAKADLGITGDENEMRVNDRVLRIESTSKLNINGDQWRTAVPISVTKLTREQLCRLPRSLDELPSSRMIDQRAIGLPTPRRSYQEFYVK